MWPSGTTRFLKRLSKIGLLILTVILLFGGIGLAVTDLTPVLVEVTNIPTPLVSREVRVVQVTDLHSDYRWSEVLEAVQVSKPDIIVLTGDFWDVGRGDNQETKNFLIAVAAMDATTFFVQGNNEKEFDPPWFMTWMRQNCPSVLFIDGKTVRFSSLGVTVSGADWGSHAKSFHLGEQDFNILLTHAPWRGNRLLRLNSAANLALTGHLHNGQIDLPIGQPICYATETGKRLVGPDSHVSGLKILESGQMLYICKGCGGGRPLPRMFNPLAVSLIRLIPTD